MKKQNKTKNQTKKPPKTERLKYYSLRILIECCRHKITINGLHVKFVTIFNSSLPERRCDKTCMPPHSKIFDYCHGS